MKRNIVFYVTRQYIGVAGAAVLVGIVLTGLALYGFRKERHEDLFEEIRRESV